VGPWGRTGADLTFDRQVGLSKDESSWPSIDRTASNLSVRSRRDIWLAKRAFILTRPLGATVGDLLDKPLAHGGLAINRYYASAILVAAIISLIVVLPQRAGAHPGAERSA